LIATALVVLFLVPIVGLSIDVGVLYLVKTKLSMAVDAGALAGARALSRGISDTEQLASAKETARGYVRVNFPDGFLPDTNLTIDDPLVAITAENRRSVTVRASVNAPLYFMRMFGNSSTLVAASGTAVRRDVNVVVVLDRSGSLQASGSCEAVKSNAVNFVNRFSEGRDNVGLVTFATSSRDDFQAASTFHSASPNVVDTIASVTCTGGTNSAQGLWQGYSQLVTLNQAGALNVILFFTDGQPTAFTGKFNIVPGNCVDVRPKIATLTVTGNPAVTNYGLLNHIAPPQPMTNDETLAPNSDGCAYAANWPRSATNVATDVARIPKIDVHGNALISGYRPVSGGDPFADRGNANTPHDEESAAVLTPENIHMASINAADSAGLRIRNGDQVAALGRGLSGVVVFSIALGNGSSGIEQDFMRRVSNVPEASNYDASRPSGLYVYAPEVSDLTQAFNRIAAEILRLAQ
jgi:Flp pilus assembly protein TadG